MDFAMPKTTNGANLVTHWYRAVESGDREAATQLWTYCFPRLMAYARKKLPPNLRRVLDEEDVALSAFKSFCLRAEDKAFPELEGRDDLWKLLLCITSRKAQAVVRHETRDKRGGGKVRGESIFESEDSDRKATVGISNVSGQQPSPEVLAQLSEDTDSLLDMLKNDTLKTIAILRTEGYSVGEIAERLGCGKRTVERRLNLIRKTWQEVFDQMEASRLTEASKGDDRENDLD